MVPVTPCDDEPGVDLDQHTARHAPTVLGDVVGYKQIEYCDYMVDYDEVWRFYRLWLDANPRQIKEEVTHCAEKEDPKCDECTLLVFGTSLGHVNREVWMCIIPEVKRPYVQNVDRNECNEIKTIM